MRLLALALLLVLSSCGDSTAQNWETWAKRTTESLVQIHKPQDYPGQDIQACNGWYIDTWKVITAAHCHKEGFTLIADQPTVVIKESVAFDIAVLLAPVPGKRLYLSRKLPRVGQEVLTVGYRGHYVYALSAMVSSLDNRLFYTWPNGIMLDENFVPGMSGAPVVDRNGEVIGMALGGGHFLSDLQTFGFVLPTPVIQVFYESTL